MSDLKDILGGSLSSPAKTPASPLGANPLSSSSSSHAQSLSFNPLSGAASTTATSKIQVSDLLPLTSAAPSLEITAQAPEMKTEPTLSLSEISPQATLDLGQDAPVQEPVQQEPLRALHLSSVGAEKIKVIKAIRAHWDLGLKDAKALADAAPLELPPLPESKAAAAEAELSSLGALLGGNSSQTSLLGSPSDHRVIHLMEAGARKIALIKVVREHWNLGLKDAKHLVDAAPVQLPPISSAATEAAQRAFAELGVTFQIK